tara:strand:- start:328 stop:501 length:174 start_codon:yes stop_codon:yes gene_type:complete
MGADQSSQMDEMDEVPFFKNYSFKSKHCPMRNSRAKNVGNFLKTPRIDCAAGRKQSS